jgi:hypothetical protein
MREGWRRAVLAIASTGITLAALEIGCERFGVESHGLNFTLASQRWMQEHWQTNELGLRDPPLDADRLARTRNLIVLGDSLAAGQGVDDPDDRASGVLRRALGPEWSVVTLASPGWSTADEIAAFDAFEWRTHVVVLWWFLNDVQSAAAGQGLRLEPDLRVRPAWLAPLVRRSYLANYWYWRIRPGFDGELGATFWRFLDRAFTDPPIWAAHEAELDRLREAARARGARLYAVVTPDLALPERSRAYAERALAYFERHGVPVIDLGAAYEGRDPRDLVVSVRDTHPNEQVHADVAARIQALLRREGWTD